MKKKRFGIDYRHCDGSGFHRMVDGEGNAVLEFCGCYRGRITVLLTAEDAQRLRDELDAAIKAGWV